MYADALRSLGTERFSALIDAEGGRQPFSKGCSRPTEMFIDQLLDLFRAGVLSRRAYDSLPLERLLASGRHLDADRCEQVLEALTEVGRRPEAQRRRNSASCSTTECSVVTWSSRTGACVLKTLPG